VDQREIPASREFWLQIAPNARVGETSRSFALGWSLVEIDEVPNGAGDVGLTVVVAPDVSRANDVRDVAVIDPAVLLAELTSISVGDARDRDRPPRAEPARWIEQQREVVSIPQIQHGFSPTQRKIKPTAGVEPVMVDRSSGQNDSNPMTGIGTS